MNWLVCSDAIAIVIKSECTELLCVLFALDLSRLQVALFCADIEHATNYNVLTRGRTCNSLFVLEPEVQQIILVELISTLQHLTVDLCPELNSNMHQF